LGPNFKISFPALITSSSVLIFFFIKASASGIFGVTINAKGNNFFLK